MKPSEENNWGGAPKQQQLTPVARTILFSPYAMELCYGARIVCMCICARVHGVYDPDQETAVQNSHEST